MKVGLLTSNQPRHLALARTLARVADEVVVVQECTTVFPGEVEDFYRRSEVMTEYFRRVTTAERAVFGPIRFSEGGVRTLAIKSGDLNRLDVEVLRPLLDADEIVVFGSSWIRPPLVDELVARRALNIHMGVSPFYRGSSTNFWAAYDGRFDLVGATVHLLTAGLDSGPVLFHALPSPGRYDAFELGMEAVRAAHAALAEAIADGAHLALDPVAQDRAQELRYTRNRDFTDQVAADYLQRLPTPDDVATVLESRDPALFCRPRVVPPTA